MDFTDQAELKATLAKLSEPFPLASINWRAQTITKEKPFKALALGYIDSRHVMNRLDEVLGKESWQRMHRDNGLSGKMSCAIGILINGKWIWKWDGAGDTDIEGAKGSYADSFKRAAVNWGVGRYLYDMDAMWVPCTVKRNGKFNKFAEDPWDYIPPQKESHILENFSRDVKMWVGDHKGTRFRNIITKYLIEIAKADASKASYSRQKAVAYARQELEERNVEY